MNDAIIKPLAVSHPSTLSHWERARVRALPTTAHSPTPYFPQFAICNLQLPICN